MDRDGYFMRSDEHIVIITPGFPKDSHDSVCIPPLQAFLPALTRLYPEMKIKVIALHYPHKKITYTWKGIPVFALNGQQDKGLMKWRLWKKVHSLLAKLHKESPIDWVHSLWVNDTTLLAQRFCSKHKVRHIATIMGQDALAGNKYLRWINWKQLPVTAPSDFAAGKFRESTGQEPEHIIPWGVDEKDFPGQSEGKSIDILGVGSLIQLKNYPLFLSLVKELAATHPSLKVVIAGKGPLEKAIHQQITSLGLQQQVTLTGELPRGEVISLMKKSKVFLHTSTYEGQGYVFLEALACGLPLVTFDVGYLPSHPLAHIATDAQGMLQILGKLLQKPVLSQGAIPTSAAQTANQYKKIYDPV